MCLIEDPLKSPMAKTMRRKSRSEERGQWQRVEQDSRANNLPVKELRRNGLEATKPSNYCTSVKANE